MDVRAGKMPNSAISQWRIDHEELCQGPPHLTDALRVSLNLGERCR